MRSKIDIALVATLLAIAVLSGCSAEPAEEHGSEEAESWAITAWGERYEIFPEVDALVAGEVAMAHTHVTVLDGFPPMTVGSVEIILRSTGGVQSFSADQPIRELVCYHRSRPAVVLPRIRVLPTGVSDS